MSEIDAEVKDVKEIKPPQETPAQLKAGPQAQPDLLENETKKRDNQSLIG